MDVQDAAKNLRQLCDEGKGRLQWERDIPQDALDNLVSLANADFHQNLGKIIHDIYLTGHNLFKDMPQGIKLIIQFLGAMNSLISNKNT